MAVEPLVFRCSTLTGVRAWLPSTTGVQDGIECRLVHSPASALENGYGDDDWDEFTRRLLEAATAARIAAVGITDYFCITGYKEVRQRLRSQEFLATLSPAARDWQSDLLVLPNVEMRADTLVTRGGQTARVNYHVIFSDELDPEQIEDSFLHGLRFVAAESPGGDAEQHTLTVKNLAALGKRLKEEHAPFRGNSDLKVGMMTATVKLDDVSDVLRRQKSRFADRYLIAVAPDEDLSAVSWNSQGHQVRKKFIQIAQVLFTANRNTHDWALGLKHDDVQSFVDEFKGRKVCLHGSDAHSYDTLFKPDLDRFCWVRADTTFAGLRQLTIEPSRRVFIGTEPPGLKRLRQDSQSVISSLEFARTDKAVPEQNWFPPAIHFNPGLVAIVGRKGSGKSALADTLGLLGRTRNHEHFSFLTSQRFLADKGALAKMFAATLVRGSERTPKKELHTPPDVSGPETVKYLPQQFLERVCTELKDDSGLFDRELREVIFSHLSRPDRQGHRSMDTLLSAQLELEEPALRRLRGELESLNTEMAAVRDLLRPDYRNNLETLLQTQKGRLEKHDAQKPAVVPSPSAGEADPAALAELETIRTKHEQAVAANATIEEKLVAAGKKTAAAERLSRQLTEARAYIDTVLGAIDVDARALGLDPKTLLVLKIDEAPIEECERAVASQIIQLKSSRTSEDSLRALQERVAEIQSSLDEPNRRFQSYTTALQEWQRRRDEILGATDVERSIKGIEEQLRQVDGGDDSLAALMSERLNKSAEILACKKRQLAAIEEIVKPAADFAREHIDRDSVPLGFGAVLDGDSFSSGLFRFIHHGHRGSFCGEKQALERVRGLMDGIDFEDESSVRSFLTEVANALVCDKRNNEAVELSAQLKQGFTEAEVWSYLFGLDYLRPRFRLEWGGRGLSALSPGERGTLLLVFYLLVDRRTCPLIVNAQRG